MVSLFPSREVVLQLGPFSVRWYGLLWVAAFGLAWYLLPRLAKYRDLKLSRNDWWYISAWAMAGAIFGGRLGYVALWEPLYFLSRPAEIFAIWEGGLASHGGLIGVGLGLLWATRHVKSLRDHVVNFWALMDIITVPAALGLALGRVGNFINQELFDPPVLAWLAVAKNLIIAGVCWWVLRRPRESAGRVVALFLLLYGILRFLVEFVRVPEFSGALALTRGQLFTLPIILAGGLLMVWRRKRASGQTR